MEICLTMIVKNEEKVIERCLKSALPHITTYAIIDTGSKDKTKQIIKKTLKGIPGQLVSRPWIDYGTNRTQAFELATQNRSEYSLVLDADDILDGMISIPKLKADVYDILVKSEGLEFWQRRLFSNKLKWRYEGKLHEYPTADNIKTSAQLPGVTINHTHDGSSWSNQKTKYEEHVKLAEHGDLNNPRNLFYYAQSLRAANRPHEAVIQYKKRAAMKTGWTQEAFYAMYMAAKIEHSLGEPERAALDYLDAYNMDPERIEPLYQLCRMLRLSDKFAAGYLVGRMAAETPLPSITDKLFLETSAWGGNMLLETGLCAYYSKHMKDAKKWWLRALEDKTITNEIHKLIKKNLEFIKEP